MKLSILLLKLENIFYSLTLRGGTETVPPLRLSKNPILHQVKIGFYFIFMKFTKKTSNLEEVLFLFHFHFASFLRFIVANLNLTQFVTCARPVYGVYLIACFSFASANTLSIFSFRSLYKSAYSVV